MAKEPKINETMSRDQIIETMRYLGWHTHDESGNVTDEAYHVAGQLAGKVTYNIMLSTQIATEVDKYRSSSRRHNGEGI